MVPKRFRARLAGLSDSSVWITNALGTPAPLDVRPNSLFFEYQARVAAIPETPQRIAFKRYYFGSAIEVDVDGAGRILIPAGFRKRLGLGDRIAFVGIDDKRFQIWRPEDLDASFDEVNANSADFLAHLAELGV